MTMAVCFHCGATKFGAFVPCPDCSAMPQDEEQLALSLAMTDHYFDVPSLQNMAADLRSGKPVHLAPETRTQLIDQIRAEGLLQKLGMLKQTGPMDGQTTGKTSAGRGTQRTRRIQAYCVQDGS